jgi:acyl-coenzyme A synthetase/AMP-(fatty) acid ligase
MSSSPLVSHSSLDQRLAWFDGEIVPVGRFLADVAQVAAILPSGGHVLNVCRDRYRFAVGLAAAMTAGKISLLPPTHTAEMVQRLKVFAPDVFCLHDNPACDFELPRVPFPELHGRAGDVTAIPRIENDSQVAIVFTSGSTGAPVPHPKTWGKLVRNVRAQAACIGLMQNTGCAVIGTVPPQHMYGFESTVLLPLQSGNVLCGTQPFYPADIVAALESNATPRMLVSTPLHLRLLLESGLYLPKVERVLSATSPLSLQLAGQVESAFGVPLLEIYGSTETGQIAVRRTTEGESWQLFPDVCLVERDERFWAEGGHVEQPVALNDKIELLPDTRFLLHGRLQDLVNIAGKRNSLASLNHHLTAIPGVLDGAFFMPDEASHEQVTRLVACVVAPGISAQTILDALRQCVDPVFLPRPLLFVDELPRNSTGKLPREALKQLIHSLTRSEMA